MRLSFISSKNARFCLWMTVILFSLSLRPACSNLPCLMELIYSDVHQAEPSLNTLNITLCAFPSLCISVVLLFVLFMGKISSSHDLSINAYLIFSLAIGCFFLLLKSPFYAWTAFMQEHQRSGFAFSFDKDLWNLLWLSKSSHLFIFFNPHTSVWRVECSDK